MAYSRKPFLWLATASLSRENAKARRRAAGRLHLSGLRKLAFTSRESAAALAAYLVGVRGGTARTDPKPPAKPAERRPPLGEPADIAKSEPVKPAAKPPGDRQITTATPAAAVPVPAPAPPAPPPEPPKPQWDIFD